MRTFEYIITEETDGKQIKDILRRRHNFSAALITKLKKYPEGITLNGEPVFANVRVATGDKLRITILDAPSRNIVPSDIKLDIIYEDEDILVVNKPRSMPSHPSQNHHSDTLANAVMYHCPDISFRVITRLDKDTSGVVVIAKNKLSAGILTKCMTNGDICKEYCAICHGSPAPESGIIDAPIARKQDSAILREISSHGKRAVTEYRVVSVKNGLSYVELKPLTGRTHQLRVHLSYVGAPIYGDDMYGSPCKDEKVRLHCRRVSLVHPITGTDMVFEAELPPDMINWDSLISPM